VYTTERTLAEHGARLSDSERRAVEQALAEAREALKAEDMERIRRSQESLTRMSQTLAEAMSRDRASGGAAGGRAPGGPAGDDVVDAEFEDSDGRKAG
jgi:molecular chaperone DnaK